MGQASPEPPLITVNGKELEVVHQFQYLGSTASATLSLDVELNKRIGKASTTLARLTKKSLGKQTIDNRNKHGSL